MKTTINPTQNQIEFNFNYTINEEVKEIFVKLNNPTWDITVEAFKYLTDENDKLDLITPGKFIFDLCATEISDELLTNYQLLMSVCSTIATKFCLPINATIVEKKNTIA